MSPSLRHHIKYKKYIGLKKKLMFCVRIECRQIVLSTLSSLTPTHLSIVHHLCNLIEIYVFIVTISFVTPFSRGIVWLLLVRKKLQINKTQF